MLRSLAVPVVAMLLGACALLPSPEPETSARPLSLSAFSRTVADALQDHDWQTLLAATDPELYSRDVVRNGIPEPWYLAKLLGLTEYENDIQQGAELQWEDLDRIAIAALAPTGGELMPHRLAGLVTLTSGQELEVSPWVTMVRGRYVITESPADPPAGVQGSTRGGMAR